MVRLVQTDGRVYVKTQVCQGQLSVLGFCGPQSLNVLEMWKGCNHIAESRISFRQPRYGDKRTAGSLVAENIDSMAGGTAISAASSCCAATAGNLGLETATLGATVVVARDEVSGTAAVQAD